MPNHILYSTNIAKGERKGKPKSHFRLGYAELHLILAANAANIEKSSWRKKSSVSFFSFNTNSIILLCYRKKLWEAILYPTQLTAFDTIIANQYSYPIAFTPGYEHTKWTDKKSKPARFVFLPPYIIFAETARKMEKFIRRNRSHQFRIIIARMQPGGMRGNLSDTIQFYPQSPTTTQRPESDSYQGRCVQVRTKLPATIRPHFRRPALRSAPVGNPAAGSAIEGTFETGWNLRSRTFQKQ